MPDTENPDPRPDPNETLVKVFDTEQESEAIVVRGLLESAGIETDLKAIELVQDAFPVGGVMILVREEEAAEAAKIIDTWTANPDFKLGSLTLGDFTKTRDEAAAAIVREQYPRHGRLPLPPASS